MWYTMSKLQNSYGLSERLIRAISQWNSSCIGELDSVEDLLEAGANVNIPHGTLMPLHCACMVGDSECVLLLLQRGAQVDAIDGYGRAAIHYAAEKDAECLELLLAHNCHPDIPDTNSNTALHWAAFKNQTDCIHILLQNGSNVNVLDFNNNSPLSWAAMKGNLESIKILLDYNACVDLVNYDGVTPLLRVAMMQASGLNASNDDMSLELLMRAHAQIHVRNSRGQLPNAIMADNRLSDMLLQHSTTPRSLQHLCRHAVRKNLGATYLPNIVPKLPLPEQLQRLILLQT